MPPWDSLSRNLTLTISIRFAGQRAPRSCPSLLWNAGVTNTWSHPWLFVWCLGFKLKSFNPHPPPFLYSVVIPVSCGVDATTGICLWCQQGAFILSSSIRLLCLKIFVCSFADHCCSILFLSSNLTILHVLNMPIVCRLYFFLCVYGRYAFVPCSCLGPVEAS